MTTKLNQNVQPRMGVLRDENNPDKWKADAVIHQGMKDLPEIREIFKKHNFKCYFCNFYDPLFIEPHHLNGNHDDLTHKNVVPACTLCHSSHHLFALSQNQSAVFGIFKDDMTQTNLNTLQRIFLVLNYHPDEQIRIKYSRNGLLGRRCFDTPIALHERRAFTDFTDYEFQEMMFKDVSRYKQESARFNERKNHEALNKNSPEIDLNNFFKGNEIDSLDYKVRKENDTDEALQERIVSFQDQFADYKKWYRERIKNNKNFSVFQLAMALKECDLEAYKNFSFGNHKILLCYKDNIFSKDQIEYYLTRDDFNLSSIMGSFNAKAMIPAVNEQIKKLNVDLE
ncbi:TPA: HNH endonuclease signature motif containing protein [Acinetobacter baumannii]|uniref:HNH endonuclease signature motif containing protein n=1 Tax=Acinetobacter baumannii TaxID=470 RepID=UPI00338E4C01